MARSRVNVLKRHIDIQRMTTNHYVEGLTTYRGVWRMYIEPLYHISYAQYIRILGLGGLHSELEEEMRRNGGGQPRVPDNQLNLLDLINHEENNA